MNVTFQEHQIVVAGYQQQEQIAVRAALEHKARVKELEQHIVDTQRDILDWEKKCCNAVAAVVQQKEEVRQQLAACQLAATADIDPAGELAAKCWTPTLGAVLKLRAELNTALAKLAKRKK